MSEHSNSGLKWEVEDKQTLPAVYSLDVGKVTNNGNPKTETVQIRDVYSQWNLFEGKSFELSQRQPKAARSSSYVDRLETLEDIPNVSLLSENEDQPSSALSGTNAENAISSTEGSAAQEKLEFVTRVPLTAASVSPDYDDKQAVTHTADDSLDSNQIIIIGVIDDGINAVNRRFRSGKFGSRVEYLWVQDGSAKAANTVPYGKEWNRKHIETAIENAGGDDVLAMEALELVGKPGSHRPSALRLRATHGTHIADLAAGYEPDDPAGLHRRIIAVQLPSIAVQDASGLTLTSFVKTAAQFVFSRALAISKALNQPIPVVLPFSFGFGGGPRNGRFVLERILRAQARKYREDTAKLLGSDDPALGAPAVRIFPSGNGRLAKGHAKSKLSEDGKIHELDVGLRVQPGDQTSSYVEIWFPDGFEGAFLSVTPPSSISSPSPFVISSQSISFLDGLKAFSQNLPITGIGGLSGEQGETDINEPPSENESDKKSASSFVLKSGGDVVARLAVDEPNNFLKRQLEDPPLTYRVLLAIAPTDTVGLETSRAPAPHGTWRIQAFATTKDNKGEIRAWVQRDDTPGTTRLTARQAYFETGNDLPVKDREAPPIPKRSHVREAGTLSGLATHAPEENEPEGINIDAVIVSGLRGDPDASSNKQDVEVPYAGLTDPAGKPPIGKIDASTIVETSRVLPNILASGTLSSTKVALNGTSMAPPRFARAIADHLQTKSVSQRASEDIKAVLNDLKLLAPRSRERLTDKENFGNSRGANS
ncbi:MAG: hypothetical protein AAFP80_07960 [Pseudomonadota bacterium]